MLKKKPIILATGCSFTDPIFWSRHKFLPDEKRGGWPMWPELIKEKIEKETGISYDLINLARSGGSNDWVFNTCLDALSGYNSRIKIVLVGGTQWMRTHIIPTNRNYNPQTAFLENPDHESWLKIYNQATIKMWSAYSNKFGIQETIYHNLRIMWTLMQICNDKKIKFIWNQLLQPFPGGNWWKKQFIEHGIPEEELGIEARAFEKQFFADIFLRSPYARLLMNNKKNFYGFEWSPGDCWDWRSHNMREEYKEQIVLPTTVIDGKKQTDAHPNKLGQEKIAELIWEEYGNYLVKN